MNPNVIATWATWTSTLINVYFIVSLTLCDLWTRHVLGVESSFFAREMLRFTGITTLLIILIHAQVASGYPRAMMLRAFAVQALYYALSAFVLWVVFPHTLLMVRLHVGALLLASVLFGLVSFTSPTPRVRFDTHHCFSRIIPFIQIIL
jgi:hypothetical protein